MKQVKVITRHGPSNYGSLLQSIATIYSINKLGYSVEIIDYQRKDERGFKAVVSAVKNKKNWNDSFIKKIIYIGVRFPIEYIAQLKFDKMRKRYLNLTSKRYFKYQDLQMLQADIFMTGSDQVWGPVLTEPFDSVYFLSFVKEKKKKIAYAASFGKTEFNEEIIEKYTTLLSSYNKITVREKSALNLLTDWNVKCYGQVLDPTLLLNPTEWEIYTDKRTIVGDYILIYQLHNNPNFDEYAQAFSEKSGLPLYRVSPYFHQIKRCGQFLYLPSLGKFLSYIKYCKYLITDSFHGTVFAINFNKDFIEILPEKKINTRNLSILKLLNLSDRIIEDFSDFSIKDRMIDYEKVNVKLENEREKSELLLKELLSN